jgi:hypothetical protein
MEVMCFIDKQRDRLPASVNELEQLTFPLLGLRRNRHILLGRQIIEEGHDQRAEVDPVFIYRQGF